MSKYGKYESIAIQFNADKKIKHGYNAVFYKIKDMDTWITDWTTNEVDEFLKSLNATTAPTLTQRLSYLRKIHEFVCELENKPVSKLTPSKMISEFVSVEKFEGKTITKTQYEEIKEQLTIDQGSKKYNYRDKVIFELAWHTLTNEEIKNLKVKDIEFVDGNVILHIKDEKGNPIRSIFVNDQDFINDLVCCIHEDTYISIGKKSIFDFNYRESDYLIKPVEKGREAEGFDGRVTNPGYILWRKLREGQIIMPDDFDVKELNIESVKRSRMIHEMTKGGTAKDKSEYLPLEIIQDMFGKGSFSDLQWLKNMVDKTNK